MKSSKSSQTRRCGTNQCDSWTLVLCMAGESRGDIRTMQLVFCWIVSPGSTSVRPIGTSSPISQDNSLVFERENLERFISSSCFHVFFVLPLVRRFVPLECFTIVFAKLCEVLYARSRRGCISAAILSSVACGAFSSLPTILRSFRVR